MCKLTKASFHLTSYIQGCHVYKDMWTPVIGEEVDSKLKSGNREGPYMVAIKRDDCIVGHVPCNISYVSASFIRHGGSIVNSVSGP